METQTNKKSAFTIALFALAILIPGVSFIVAWFTVGWQPFVLGLGWVSVVGFSVVFIYFVITLVAMNSVSPNKLFWMRVIALIQLIIFIGCMFFVAVPISRVPYYMLTEESQLTKDRATKMLSFLDKKKRAIIIFTTEQIYTPALIKLRAEDLGVGENFDKKSTKLAKIVNGIDIDSHAESLLNLMSSTANRFKFCYGAQSEFEGKVVVFRLSKIPNYKLVPKLDSIK